MGGGFRGGGSFSGAWNPIFVPPLPAVLLSLPYDVAAPAPAVGREECFWTGATGARVAGSGKKLLHFVVMASGEPDDPMVREAQGADARLTSEGRERCRQLQQLTDSLRPDLFVISPLTRSAQTALLSFGPQMKATGAHIIALEEVRETVNHPCDARRNCTELVAEFPTIDFSGCAEQDPVWPNYERRFIGSSADPFQPRESADVIALAARARRALGWLAARPEKEVVIVSHRDFLWNTINVGQPDGKFPDKAPVYDFGDDDVRRWMCSAFADCEVRSVIADFDPPPKPGVGGGRIAPTGGFGI